MAEDPIPSSEPEITLPQPAAAPRPARPAPDVIDGEATEIRDEATGASAAPAAEASDARAAPPREPPPLPSYALPAAAGFGGAILGAALALITAWAIEPHAAAVNDMRGRLATLEKSTASETAAATALEKRIAALETGDVNKGAVEALDRRVGTVEAAAGDVKTALDQARAARADAAKALAAAQAVTTAAATDPMRARPATPANWPPVWPSWRAISPPPPRGSTSSRASTIGSPSLKARAPRPRPRRAPRPELPHPATERPSPC